MLTEKYDFRITDQMTIPLRPHWIANDSYREKCKMLVLNRSKGEIHKVDFSKLTDYIKEGDVICFNDSTIINHMFICKTRQNRLIKIVLEGFLPNNRVIISGLLKERLNANDVFYLVDNPEISIKIEQRFSEESQYRAVVENHEALICYLASHGERLDEYVDSSLFYKYPDAYWPETNSKSPERMAAEYPCSSYREWRSAGKTAIRCVIMLSSDSVNTSGGNKMNVTYTT